MLNRDFFKIIIKIIGLYFILEIIFEILASLTAILGFNTNFGEKLSFAVYSLVVALLWLVIFYFLIKFPEKIIDFFKLDKGFDNDKIAITNFNAKNILTIAIFVIGGFLIIQNFMTFIAILYYKFRLSTNPAFQISPYGLNDFILVIGNLLLGSVLIIYRKNIAHYFEK